MNATALAPRPVPWRPETRRGRYVFGVGFRQSGFQTVVARASRPCVGRTIRTGGTPVPLPWKRSGRSNFLCLTACRAREWLNTYRRHAAPRHRPSSGSGTVMRDLVLLAASLAALCLDPTSSAAAAETFPAPTREQTEFFENRIRPVLVE